MEIKAILREPYTNEEKLNFIVEQNHNNGYEIIETEKALEAWGRTQEEISEERETNFKKEFFYINGYGWYRKTPKGYSSAVESIMALGMFYSATGVPEGILTFYEAPDFSQENQCNEEWLVENSYKNSSMTAEELQEFITKFMMSWNKEEHQ